MSSHPKLTPEILETLRRHCGKGADLDAVQALLWATWSPGMEQEPHSQTTEGPASPRDSMESPLPSRGRNSRQLLEALPWPSFILKGDTILETNEDGLRLLNAASQTSLPRSLTDTLGPGSAKSDMPPGQWVQYKLLGGDNQTSSVRGQTIPIDDQHTLLILEDQAYLDHLKSSLRETLSLFKSVINTSLNGIMAFDSVRDETGALIDFRWTVVNDAALGMVPFDRETLLGSRLLELMPGNKESGLFDAYARVVETGETFEIEQHYDHEEEGISAWFKITAVKTGDGFAVTFADITPMRQTLEDLNRQKELLDLFISHAPAAVAMFDKEMRYLMASQRWLLDYGLEGQDITGCSHFDVFPELGDHWREIYKACLDGATEYSEEEAVPRLDGKTDWIRWEIHPWYTNTNRQGGIIMFSEVITERKRYQEKIRQSERRLRAFIDAVPAGLLAIDQSGLPQYANQAAMSLLDRPYLLDDPVPFPFRHSLERSSGMMYPLRKLPLYLALEGQTTTVNDLDILHHKERIPIEISASPIRDQDGQIDFAVAVFSDISERLRIDKIKSEFISTVSHELRTPLTAIQGSLGLILGTADGSLSPMAEEMLSIAHRNSERLVLLINDILDMEKIQSGSIEFDFQPLLLDHEVLNGIQDIAGMSLALGIPIELTTPPTGLTVHADSPRLQQVLANLLSNALKFSAPNSVVEVEVKGEGTDVRISILDRGKGINPEFESRLFERFAQGDSSDSRRKGGTGLGLSISKAIVDRMRGSIAYAPRPGGGERFHSHPPIPDPKNGRP